MTLWISMTALFLIALGTTLTVLYRSRYWQWRRMLKRYKKIGEAVDRYDCRKTL